MKVPLTEEEKMRLWVDTWKTTAVELDRIKTEELQALTEEQSARCFDDLAWPSEQLWFSPERSNSEGLVEQQRLFRNARKH